MLERAFWTLLFLGMATLTGWNVLENRQLQTTPGTAQPATADEFLDVRTYELSQSGKILSWPATMEVLGARDDDPHQAPYQGYGLVLALDDLSCDVCRDEQTQFALALARSVDERMLRIVVSSSKKMYARSYMRLNSVDVPVFYDSERAFLTQNQLGRTPLLMFHNPQGEVIAAHFPIPGRPEVSKPFHDFCRQFFGLEESTESSHF